MKIVRFFFSRRVGFTLLELLVVVSILGAVSAIAIPNVVKFSSSGQAEAANSELHNVQIAVSAAMTEAGVKTIAGGPLSATQNLTFSGENGTHAVSEYILGGIGKLKGTYTVDTNGGCFQNSYTP